MTESEVAKILTMIAAFDRRTIGEADVEAWHLILGDIDAQDAATAVRNHYADRSTWIMPADVRGAAIVLDRKRRGARRVAEIEAELAAETTPPSAIAHPVRELLAGAFHTVKLATKDEIAAEAHREKLELARAEINARRRGTA